MVEFGAKATLEVPRSEIRAAKAEIEDGLDVEVGVQPSQMTGGGGGGLGDVVSETQTQTEQLDEVIDLLEDISDGGFLGGGGGGGGGGLLPSTSSVTGGLTGGLIGGGGLGLGGLLAGAGGTAAGGLLGGTALGLGGVGALSATGGLDAIQQAGSDASQAAPDGLVGSGLSLGNTLTLGGLEGLSVAGGGIKGLVESGSLSGAADEAAATSEAFGEASPVSARNLGSGLSDTVDDLQGLSLPSIEAPGEPDWLGDLDVTEPDWLSDLGIAEPAWLSQLSIDRPAWLSDITTAASSTASNIGAPTGIERARSLLRNPGELTQRDTISPDGSRTAFPGTAGDSANPAVNGPNTPEGVEVRVTFDSPDDAREAILDPSSNILRRD